MKRKNNRKKVMQKELEPLIQELWQSSNNAINQKKNARYDSTEHDHINQTTFYRRTSGIQCRWSDILFVVDGSAGEVNFDLAVT